VVRVECDDANVAVRGTNPDPGETALPPPPDLCRAAPGFSSSIAGLVIAWKRTMLHRSALTITRKQPYADWANRAGDDGADAVAYTDDLPRTVYLVPAIGSPDAVSGLLDEFWADIFEEELAAWSEDEATWPVPRTRPLFDDWFDVELTDSVVDLIPEEPLTSADMESAAVDDALRHCAWCDLALDPDEGRNVALKLAAERERLAEREGRALTLIVDDDHAVSGILTARDSSAAAAGEDLVFRACTSACEKRIRKEVPRALRRLLGFSKA
jgi:hypothetical protein